MKRKTTSPKTKAVKRKAVKSTRTTKQPEPIQTLPFHETFPVTLEHKDGKESKKCFFVCKEHCDTYIKRYKLKKGSYSISKTVPRNEEKE